MDPRRAVGEQIGALESRVSDTELGDRPGLVAEQGWRGMLGISELTGASADGLCIFASMAEAVDGRVAA